MRAIVPMIINEIDAPSALFLSRMGSGSFLVFTFQRKYCVIAAVRLDQRDSHTHASNIVQNENIDKCALMLKAE